MGSRYPYSISQPSQAIYPLQFSSFIVFKERNCSLPKHSANNIVIDTDTQSKGKIQLSINLCRKYYTDNTLSNPRRKKRDDEKRKLIRVCLPYAKDISKK